jgi:hypothetical protein
MSDIGLIMNALLGVLLLGALAMGWRLERRLKALRSSHASFTRAVEDLDRAAARAEQGLADLRAATDEAAETLAGRIDRAGHLAGRLETLTAEATLAEARLAAAPRPEPVRAAELVREARPAQTRESAFARFAERYGARPSAPAAHSPAVAASAPLLSAFAEAAARNDLILEDEIEEAPPARAPRIAPEAAARIERLRALARPPVAAATASRPATRADDELFDAPPLRRAAGGLR